MFNKRQFFLIIILFLLTTTPLSAQPPHDDVASIRFGSVEFDYSPATFGALLPAYDEGTPFQTDAPYFANVAPHTSFLFMRPDPARPDVDLTGELRVYRLSDIESYAEPSYKAVVEQLRTLDTRDLGTYATVGADYRIPSLPFMPVLNATQVFRVSPREVMFDAVKGIEYFTYYSQSPEPILEGQVMYTFQGITTNQKYYISFSIYIEMGLLKTRIPDDINWDTFAANYAQYLQDTYGLISNADTATSTPSPEVMHRFIDSLSVGG